MAGFDKVLASCPSSETDAVKQWLEDIFNVTDVGQLAIPAWHPFDNLDRVLITATRDAVDSSTDQGGLPCRLVHKVKASLSQ